MENFNSEIWFNNNLIEILENSRERFIPTMLKQTAKFLYGIVKEEKPKNILEIGTAVGYSGIVMKLASKESKLTTIEVDAERQAEAKENFKKFSLDSGVTFINDDGYNAIIKLKEQNKKYDFIFLDGPKGQYLKYFEVLKHLMSENCILVADDVLFNYQNVREGAVAHKHRAMTNKLREFVITMLNSEEYSVKLYNIDEGIMVITKASVWHNKKNLIQ